MIDTTKLAPWGSANQQNPLRNDWNWQDQMNPGNLTAANGGATAPAENTGYGLTGSGFLFPQGWSQSASALQKLGREPIATPSSWTTGMEALTPMSQTGQPVSSDAWWAATQGTTNRTIEDAIKNAAEQAGLGGMRWSTPLGATAQDISGKYMGQAAQEWADREMAAQEAARARQLEATGQLYQYGQGQYQMTQDEYKRRQQAAAAAGNLASQQTELALRVLPMMFGMGNTAQDTQQQAINNSYNNPYANMAQNYLGQQQRGLQQGYQPSGLTNSLGVWGGGLGSMGDIFGGGGRGNSTGTSAGNIASTIPWNAIAGAF